MRRIYKILLVEDEEINGKILSHTMEKYNFSIDFALDANAAFRLFNPKTYDLLIVDIRLPGLDGFDVIQRIREQEPTIPVMMITASERKENVERAMQYKVQAFLLKPLIPERLKRKILQTLSIQEDELFSKQQNPFQCSVKQVSNIELEVNLKGCPLRKLDVGDVLKETLSFFAKNREISYIDFDVDEGLLYYPDSLIMLDEIVARILKSTRLLPAELFFKGLYFQNVEKKELQKLPHLSRCKFQTPVPLR
ncbi:MAG: response regulator [Leptospiraceae bacterium]|nr:response regulator [Leptospiraceae bacterium]MCP5499915.1 response regulator [Leptospiraceae bacterium]